VNSASCLETRYTTCYRPACGGPAKDLRQGSRLADQVEPVGLGRVDLGAVVEHRWRAFEGGIGRDLRQCVVQLLVVGARIDARRELRRGDAQVLPQFDQLRVVIAALTLLWLLREQAVVERGELALVSGTRGGVLRRQ